MSKYSPVFSHVFILASNGHEQNTRFASHSLFTKQTCNTSKYKISYISKIPLFNTLFISLIELKNIYWKHQIKENRGKSKIDKLNYSKL